MKKIILVLFGLLFVFGFCYAYTSQEYANQAEKLYIQSSYYDTHQSTNKLTQANYWLLKAIYEEERQQTQYLMQLNNRVR